jgi:two-component system, OmpR family, sensor kinase
VDGIQRKLKQSLQYKLSVWLCLAITAIAIAGGTFAFFSAFNEANEQQDDQLRQVAALFNNHVALLKQQNNMEAGHESSSDSDPEFRVLVQIISPSGIEVLGTHQPPLAIPAGTVQGIKTITVNDEEWRIFVKALDAKQQVVVAQKIVVRDGVASESATATLIPFVILIPVLLLIVSYLVREMFKPVKRLARDLDERAEQDIHEIDQTHLPSEITPFVAAINRMLLRVDHSVELQRRFVADAAHEMRTPLTALSLQVERLAAAETPEQARARLTQLKNGLERTSLLLNQLLALARAQQTVSVEKTEVSVQHVFRRVLEDLMPLVQAKHIDLGVTSEIDARVSVHEIDLSILIKNLVDNAIRYTPEGGQVDLSIHGDKLEVIIQIDDTGPGIPKHERGRVFDPFYRVIGNDIEGSGLGLSIVKTIATKIGAQIHLDDSVLHLASSGLCVSVVIPLPRNGF